MSNMIDKERLTEDEAKKRLIKLIDLKYSNNVCEMCGLPCLHHRGDTCVRSNCVEEKEECHVWKVYREKIKAKVVWMKITVTAEREKTGW